MKPSPQLFHRIRFTTKEVGRGFYRGNRTGAMGAHTEYGGYVIDWRKVRHYNVPDLTNFELQPFVAKSIDPREKLPRGEDGHATWHYEPKKVSAMDYLQLWRVANPQEFDDVWNQQQEQLRSLQVTATENHDDVAEQTVKA
ncbi:hypothetical protein DV738_g2942, partial [Chaetothyriales sp. CBS 135597]